MKLSLVIPTYTLNEYLEGLALDAANSYKDHVDQLIICEDGGNFSQALFDIADVYIYNKDNVGFTKNVNRGWHYAQGDFVGIASSDTRLMSGNLGDLCLKDFVTSPEVTNQLIPRLAGPFWVSPKEITQQYGYLREEMHTYSSDSEYDNRMADVFRKVPSVRILHLGAQTVKAAGVEGGEQQHRDRLEYQKLVLEGKAK